MLALYAEHDPWVPVRTSMDVLAKLDLPNVTAMAIPGADHVMMTGRKALDQVDPDQFGRDAPDCTAYFDAMSGWLSAVLRGCRR